MEMSTTTRPPDRLVSSNALALLRLVVFEREREWAERRWGRGRGPRLAVGEQVPLGLYYQERLPLDGRAHVAEREKRETTCLSHASGAHTMRSTRVCCVPGLVAPRPPDPVVMCSGTLRDLRSHAAWSHLIYSL